MKFLKLIRYRNLLMLAFMQLIFHFGFLKQQPTFIALADWQFLLLVLATICIAAGGYIINNIADVEADLENKPQNVVIGNGISETAAYNWYIALNITGIVIGFYLSEVIGKSSFTSAFVITAMALYIYANGLKRYLIIGNVLIALLLAFSVLIVGLFDILPAMTMDNRRFMKTLMQILLDYAIFTFVINFIREIIKDIEDVNGDYNQGMNTLPIALGVSRTTKIVFVLSFIPLFLVSWYIYEYIFELTYATIYGLIFIIAPLLFATVKLWSAEKKKDYTALSMVLKWIMLFGILSIVIITVNMKLNAN